MLKLAPSILAADFSALWQDIKAVEDAGAEYLHIDVMDGHFVPNLSLGLPVIESIRKKSALVFDVHLMISEPEKYIETFAAAGADNITVHLEVDEDINKLIKQIKELGKKVGVSIKPQTPVEKVFDIAPFVDMILLMSVDPGFGGQKFIDSSLQRASALRRYFTDNNITADIQMDGGVNLDNVKDVIMAGVNVIVAGSSVFRTGDIGEAVKQYKNIFSSI